jgi:hypothetical protein
MRVRSTSLASAAASAGLLVLLAGAPAAAQVCDAYSGSCTPVTGVLPTNQGTGTGDTGGGSTVGGGNGAGNAGTGTVVRGSAGNGQVGGAPATLPFTGGELVLVSLAGAGAVAAGAGLVVAGRRRTATA